MEGIQIAGLLFSLISSGFWLGGAAVRFLPFSLSRLRGPDSIPAALERQSLLNAIAAVFAALAAGAQALIYYWQIPN